MTNSFRKFRCWRTPVVQDTILGDIGMLRLKADAVFLAAHAPVPVERLKGAVAPGDGEAEILNALRGELGLTERNTIIAITGDVGTGKSHAVRWVRAHLREDLQRLPNRLCTPRCRDSARTPWQHPRRACQARRRRRRSADWTRPSPRSHDSQLMNSSDR